MADVVFFPQLPRCQKLMNENCVEMLDEMNCRAAAAFCDSELSTGYWASGEPTAH